MEATSRTSKDREARIEYEHGNIVRVAQPGTGKAMKRRDPDARV
jgi:hypothetical protein